MILSVFSLNVTLAEYFTAFTTMSMAGMTGQEQTTECSFSLFLISVIIFVTLLAPRCAGSPSEKIYFVLGNFYLCVMDVKTLQRARLWKCWAQQVMFQEKKIGRNVSHGFALPGRQGKILPQGETKKSLIFVCHIVRTSLSRGWEVWIHLWLFHMKITVLIRKWGRRKMGQLLDN